MTGGFVSDKINVFLTFEEVNMSSSSAKNSKSVDESSVIYISKMSSLRPAHHQSVQRKDLEIIINF